MLSHRGSCWNWWEGVSSSPRALGCEKRDELLLPLLLPESRSASLCTLFGLEGPKRFGLWVPPQRRAVALRLAVAKRQIHGAGRNGD